MSETGSSQDFAFFRRNAANEGRNENKGEGICELCGHHAEIHQKAHTLAKGKKSGGNLLMLCPTGSVIFDTHVKPKIYKALVEGEGKLFPE